MIGRHSWKWSAFGKHPVSRDYFKIGHEFKLSQAFSSWVESGYLKLNRDRDSNPNFYSWRFWAKGPKRGDIICGMLRDSSDTLGRVYPLMILGYGRLKAWEDNWDILPVAFEETWSQMEHLAAGRFEVFKHFEDEVMKIKTPDLDLPKFAAQRDNYKDIETISGLDTEDILEKLNALRAMQGILLPLNVDSYSDQLKLVCLIQTLAKKHIGPIPNSIFMGGVAQVAFFAVFMGPLNSNDFVRLWSAKSET